MGNISIVKSYDFKNFALKLLDSKYFILLYLLCFGLVLGLEYFEGVHFEFEWLFVLGIGFLGLFLTVFSVVSVDKMHRVAFVIILLFGLLAVFYYPILSLPDETEHFTRAEITSHGDLFLKNYNEHGYQTIKSTTRLIDCCYEIAFGNSVIDDKIDYGLSYEDSAFAHILFFCYVPQAFGVLLAKILDLNSIWMLWLGRLCNLVVYACISAFAIRKAPFFKLHLFVVACLPLSIQQAASMSSDAMFISLGLLTLAYFFYLYVKEEASVGFKEIVVFFVLSLLVALIKPPFIMLSALILLVPKSNFKTKKEYKIAWIGLISIFLIVLAINIFYSIPQLNNSSRQLLYSRRNVNPEGQLKFILTNPYESFLTLSSPIFLFSIFGRLFYFGDIMSEYDVAFISKSLILVFVLYYVMLFLYPRGDLKLNKKTRVGVFCIISIIYFGVLFVQYLTWTSVGANMIGGLQGRYILPVLTLLPLSFSFNTNFSFLNDNKKELKLLFIVLMIVFLSAVVILAINFYYMSGQYGGKFITNFMRVI